MEKTKGNCSEKSPTLPKWQIKRSGGMGPVVVPATYSAVAPQGAYELIP
jgi:hypothetical protein